MVAAGIDKTQEAFFSELPIGWRYDRLKDVVSLRNDKTRDKSSEENYLELEDIEQGTGKLLSKKNTLDVESAVIRFKKGDVLFGKLRPYLEKYYYADFDGKCTGEILAFYPRGIKGHFLRYCVATPWFIGKCNALAYGAKMPRVNWPKQLALFDIPIPPINEQIRITSYLDKTCAAIDNAIEAKQKQLEILDVLRKSIIHKAVTRGLDDSVELKDSGVEWLGRIPRHWFIDKLKNQCQIIPSNVDKKSHDDEAEVRLCNYVNVYYNEFIDDSIEYMVATANEHELKKFQLLEGDVLITKDSEDPHDIAVPALVIRTQPKLLCGYHLSIIRSNNQNFNGSYLFWALNDVSIASQLHREATGITRWAIANKHVKNSTIPLPPDTEQKLIASYLNKKCIELSRLHENIEKQISTLEQHRKSLIHECVTGKRRITEEDMQDQL